MTYDRYYCYVTLLLCDGSMYVWMAETIPDDCNSGRSDNDLKVEILNNGMRGKIALTNGCPGCSCSIIYAMCVKKGEFPTERSQGQHGFLILSKFDRRENNSKSVVQRGNEICT